VALSDAIVAELDALGRRGGRPLPAPIAGDAAGG